MSHPVRPGHYYLYSDGKRVGVATLQHTEHGGVRVSARESLPVPGGGPVLHTMVLISEFERLDATWASVLDDFARGLGVSPSSLTFGEVGA